MDPMKPRLLLLLLLCAPLLSACYRQTEDTFQQADSAEAVIVASPTTMAAGDGADALEGTPPVYLTPETVPGQVEPPTVDAPTRVIIGATSPSMTLTPFTRPTATLSFEEGLDPDHACVYTVVSGDNLYRLSLAWGTTVEAIMDASQITSDALSIGQLLLRPGCEYATATAVPTVSPAPVLIATSVPEATAEALGETEAESSAAATIVDAADAVAGATSQADAEPEPDAAIEATAQPTLDAATPVPPEPTATPTPSVHVVSAGDTIESISLKYRVDVNELIALNNLANPNQLAVGQELKLPG